MSKKTEDDLPLRIRQRERVIAPHELRKILIKNIDSGYRITIQQRQQQQQPRISGYIIDFEDEKHETVLIGSSINDSHFTPIRIDAIEMVEFDAGYTYQGLTSKIFWVV